MSLVKEVLKMKKYKKEILTACFSLAFYCFVMHLMLLWEYSEKYETAQSVLLLILPALPGVALAVLLIRNSLKEFLKSWAICLVASACVCLIWIVFRIDLMIYTFLTGFDEIGLGESILSLVMFFSYMLSCTVGCIVAAVVSFCKQKTKLIINEKQKIK